MNRLFSLAAVMFSLLFINCSDSTPVNVDIGEIGEVEDVLSVQALTGDGKIHLSWDLPSDAIGVSIRRSETEFPFSVTSGEEIYAGDASEFIDEDVLFDKKYYYLIVAIDDNLNFAGGKKIASSTLDYGNIVREEQSRLRGLKIASDDDFIYAAGRDYSSSISDNTIRIEKYTKTNPEFVTEFGTSGFVTANPTASEDSIRYFNILNNLIYIYTTSDEGSKFLIFDKNTGANIDIMSYGYNEIILDEDSIYTIDKSYNTAVDLDKLFISTGNHDETFGSDGVLTFTRSIESISAACYSAYATSDSESIYLCIIWYTLVAMDVSVEYDIYKIDKFTGSFDLSFGSNGLKTIRSYDYTATGYNNSVAICNMVIDGDYLYLMESTTIEGTLTSSIYKVNKDTGLFSSDFNSGIISIDNLVDNYLKIYDNYIYYIGTASYGETAVLHRINKTTGSETELFTYDSEYDSSYNYELNFSNDSIFLIDGSIIKKINIADGLLSADFGTSGLIEYSSAIYIDNSIQTDDNYIYIPLVENISGYYAGNWHIEIRDKNTGHVVTGPLIVKE